MSNREAITQSILLARSFEEADAAGALLTAAERREATEHAIAAGGSLEERAARRASDLLALLDARVRGLATLRAATRLPGRVLLALPAAGFVLGLATNALGPERRVNVLALPLLGLLAWNALVYALLAFEAVWHRTRARRAGASTRRTLGRLLGSMAAGAGRGASPRDPGHAAIVRRALARYSSEWAQASAARAAARLRAALHLAAATAVAGVILGMYARGIAFEYRATWESTFLGAPQVAVLLRALLGPAAAALGVAVPDAAAIAAMRGPEGSGDAAPWIHLWATTGLLFVLLPRLALAAAAWHRSRPGANLPIDPAAGSFRGLLGDDRGEGRAIEVVPYSLTLEARAADGLRELLHDVFGARARIVVRPPVEYGDDATADGASEPRSPDCRVIVFPLAQPPESEVHGRAAAALAEAGGRSHGRHALLAIVDGSAWRERFAGLERRRDERRRAWDRVLDEVGIDPLHLDLDAPLPRGVAEEAEARLPALARESGARALRGTA